MKSHVCDKSLVIAALQQNTSLQYLSGARLADDIVFWMMRNRCRALKASNLGRGVWAHVLHGGPGVSREVHDSLLYDQLRWTPDLIVTQRSAGRRARTSTDL